MLYINTGILLRMTTCEVDENWLHPDNQGLRHLSLLKLQTFLLY